MYSQAETHGGWKNLSLLLNHDTDGNYTRIGLVRAEEIGGYISPDIKRRPQSRIMLM